MATTEKTDNSPSATEPKIDAYCWTGSKFVSLPKGNHSQMTMEEIENRPEIAWSKKNQQWEFVNNGGV